MTIVPPSADSREVTAILADLTPKCDDPECGRPAAWAWIALDPGPCGCPANAPLSLLCTPHDAYWFDRDVACPACKRVFPFPAFIGRREHV